MRPLFLLGNKRSGTSHLVSLLNQHPAVFVTHESDVVWLLRQATLGQPPSAYPWDGERGLRATVAAAGDLLDAAREDLERGVGVRDTFTAIQLRLMTSGSAVQTPYSKPQVQWLGDKKPVQQADPEVLAFTTEHFPDARFLHIVRHPRAVVSSMQQRAQSGAPVAFWSQPVDHVLDMWCRHEEWAIAAEESLTGAMLSLKYEDLIADAASEMARIYAFLDLEVPEHLGEEATQATRPGANEASQQLELPQSARADALMARYGYQR